MLPFRQLARSLGLKKLLPVATTSVSRLSTSSCLRYANRDDLPSNNDPKSPNQPHVTNIASTLGRDVPQVGKKPPPPEFIGSVDPNYKPLETKSAIGSEDEVSGSQRPGHGPQHASESEWATFIAEPIKRVGEDEKTMRARLFYQSRKRGILETDLLLSTFADEHLPTMSVTQMQEYDAFLDENDWDIYYWCTQDPPVTVNESTTTTVPDITAKDGSAMTEKTSYNTSSSKKTASEAHPDGKIQPPPGALHLGSIEQPNMNVTGSAGDISAKGIEWAQTVGTVKVAYKPVPQKWQGSWVFAALRDHVESRRRRGDNPAKGMSRMPDLKQY